MTHEYDDIINLPHHVSKVHPQMSMMKRAAQFAPFAALSGYAEAIREVERQTESQIELDDERIYMLNKKIKILCNHINEHPEVCITYFLPDERKEGGYYHKYSGNLRNISEYERLLVFKDGKTINIPSIYDIDGSIFDSIEI